MMDYENSVRYDRQIRLWGQHGQSKCSLSKVCLINCDSLGLEVLKGLCLAGIGSFTILDSHKLLPEDVGSSFIPQSSVGKNRGETAKNMLLELNDEVSGDSYPVETFLPHVATADDCDEEFWKKFNCVIVSGLLNVNQIHRIGKTCWSSDIPLILCKSIGFYGIMTTHVNQHIVVDSHPEWGPKEHEAVIIQTTPFNNEKMTIREEEDEDEFLAIYICSKATDLFFTTYGRLPGYHNAQVETDVGQLKDCVKKIVGKSVKSLDFLYEFCRYGGTQLHATSAFLGGCVTQEVLKLITNQYVPVNDTLVYNAMSATTRAFKLRDLLKVQT